MEGGEDYFNGGMMKRIGLVTDGSEEKVINIL